MAEPKNTLITPEKKNELIGELANVAWKGLEIILRGLADICRGQEKKEDKHED